MSAQHESVPPSRHTSPTSHPTVVDPLASPPKALRPGELAEPVSLNEFFLGVAELFQLPPKRPTAATGVAAVNPPAKRTAPKLVLPALAVLLSGLAAVSALRVSPAPELPPPLLGVWTTSHPDFVGRTLAFTDSAVEMGVSPNGARERFPIRTLRARENVEGLHLVVAYGDPDDPISLQFTFRDGPKPEVEFTRPEGLVWTRAMSTAATGAP